MTADSIEKLTPEYGEAAVAARERLDLLLGEIAQSEKALTTNYVQLGLVLEEIRAQKYWIVYGATSFGKWLKSLHEQVQKGRSQLYAVIGVVEKLLPLVGEDKLIQMGISKAQELKALVTAKPDRPIAPEVIEVAINPKATREQLRVAIHEYHDIKPENPGTWRDFGGGYYTAEEWAEVQYTLKLAERTDPPIPVEWPDWARRKEAIARLCMEYRATYEAEAA